MIILLTCFYIDWCCGTVFSPSLHISPDSLLCKFLIFYLCRHSASYMTLLLVYFKYAFYFNVKLRVYIRQPFADIFMYRTFTYPKLLCCRPYSRFVVDYKLSEYDSSLGWLTFHSLTPILSLFTDSFSLGN